MYCEIKGKETITVEITCKCQECGTEKTFTQSFVTAECSYHKRDIAAEVIDLIMADMKKAVQEEGAEGFENKKVGTTDRGVSIKYCRPICMQVEGYFGNTIQIR
jgi:membrane-bound ClpP family serine protease